MTGKSIRSFSGFSAESIEFLKNVSEKNSKRWFEENRSIYEEYLLEPFRHLVMDLGCAMLGIDPLFEMRPLINKTISKIYRDTRFSRDKSLFKRAMWLTFKRPSEDWKDAPSYFFELMVDSYRFGLGFYSASRITMDILRKSIDKKPEHFLEAISFCRNKSIFELKGDKYKRPIKCSHSELIQDWYQRKSFYVVCARNIDKVLFSPALVKDLSKGFADLAPLYNYLQNSLELKKAGR